jgi:immune inhibitor A
MPLHKASTNMDKMNNVFRVPPAPNVMAQLYADYKRSLKKKKMSFKEYLEAIGFSAKKPDELPGRDSGRQMVRGAHVNLVAVPKQPVIGPLRVMVLLVDFPDNVGQRRPHEFEDMLFSSGKYLTGSMHDFYKEVSKGKVDISGSVDGWLRMPKPYSYYVGGDSGTGAYPTNAQRLTEDALAVAITKGVSFPNSLDKFNKGSITALLIVHAGQGAEVMSSVELQKQHIWSHKADMNSAYQVKPGLSATNYLTVPEDCRMGVVAHELGHLAFQWDDFYDPNYDRDGSEWAGAGNWDLMAGGSWNDGGNTPAHPAGLHIAQHGWATMIDLTTTKRGIKLPPYKKAGASIVRVKSPAYGPTEWLIIENRARQGFDAKLPGSGLLVWRVDTNKTMNTSGAPAMLLVQADGRHDLERPMDFNTGDAGDPFPGPAGKVTSLSDIGELSTSFPGKRSGISLSKIVIDPRTKVASLDIIIK